MMVRSPKNYILLSKLYFMHTNLLYIYLGSIRLIINSYYRYPRMRGMISWASISLTSLYSRYCNQAKMICVIHDKRCIKFIMINLSRTSSSSIVSNQSAVIDNKCMIGTMKLIFGFMTVVMTYGYLHYCRLSVVKHVLFLTCIIFIGFMRHHGSMIVLFHS